MGCGLFGARQRSDFGLSRAGVGANRPKFLNLLRKKVLTDLHVIIRGFAKLKSTVVITYKPEPSSTSAEKPAAWSGKQGS